MNTSQGPAGGPGIVTPEAVLLEFATAGVGSRTAAELIDVAIQVAALGVLALAAGALSGAVGGTVAVIGVLVFTFLIIVGYPVAFEALWNGRTPGKAALGLRVVTVEGGPERFRHAAIRAIIGVFELWIFLGTIAVVSVILTRRDQRLGDLTAGTIVLRERAASATTTVPVSFPPPYGYEGYVASLDVSALTAEQYGLIRTFLLRVLDLTGPARASLAATLGNQAASQVRHTPPPGIHPEVFLVCVASAYQRRHGRT